MAQFPLDMGRGGRVAGGTSAGSSAIVPMTVDGTTGAARYDAIVLAQHRGKSAVHTQFSALVEKRPEDVVRLRPSPAEEAAAAARTASALGSIVEHAMTHARSSQVDPAARARSDEAQFIRYTPAVDAPGYSSATAQRIIRMVDAAVDPLQPPKFKHKKLPGGPPDAPVPIMHSPTRKATAEDSAAWKIPPAISNWKNPHGHVVPLDKRLAADGRSLLEPVINDNFAKLSESLLIAERKARVEVETRATIQKKLAVKEKDAKEAELRALAARARAERSGIANLAGGGLPAAYGGYAGGEEGGLGPRAAAPPSALLGGAYDEGEGATPGGEAAVESSYYGARAPSDSRLGMPPRVPSPGEGEGAEPENEEDRAAARERDLLRGDRKRERERELRSEAAGKKSRTVRDGDRDVSERIALGMPVGSGAAAAGGTEGLYDARLFNQSEGMQAGFGAEDGTWWGGGCGRRGVVRSRTGSRHSIAPPPAPPHRLCGVLRALARRGSSIRGRCGGIPPPRWPGDWRRRARTRRRRGATEPLAAGGR